MIDYPQAPAVCRAGPEGAARMICGLFHEPDLLKTEVAALKAENAALRNECQLLRAGNQVLRVEVRELKEKASKDSHNSSKPPSSGGLSKPKPKSLRQPGKRHTGGQPGHPGHPLRMVDQPDHTVRHPVERCAGCGCSLADQAPNRIERRQVFDLPEPRLEVTEHQAEVKTCACGCCNRAAFPPDVTAPVQYGPRVKGVAVYFKESQLLPFNRVSETIRGYLSTARKNGLNALDALRRVFQGTPFMPPANNP